MDKTKHLEVFLDLLDSKVHFAGTTKGQAPISIDYVQPLGEDLGYTSLELLLLSLGSCMATALLTFLRRSGKTVNSLNDANDGVCDTTHCSLREAISTAVSGDIINFSVTGTIILTSGSLPIPINLTITGPGITNLTIDGNANDRTIRVWLPQGVMVYARLAGVVLKNANGGEYQQAVNSLPVNQRNDLAAIHSAMLVLQGKNPADPSTSVFATNSDPLLQWNISVPVNNQDTVIDGVELAVQHWFGESGFGVQANYTAVSADDEYDITQDTTQFAMIGLSDSANLVGFYDRDGLQVRVGYNWRDEFLSLLERGGQREPEFTEAFGQIDMSVSYDLTENLTVSFEGVNVTGENYRRHARQDYQLWDLEDLGARYNAGIRYTF